MAKQQRVAIIGAGPSGMSLMAAFRNAEMKGVEIPEIVCFEKQSDMGGLWNLTWRTGLDESGEPVHSSMYRYLWSNGPKECLEMADYPFSEHFKKPIPSFPPRVVLRDYLMGKAKKYGIQKYVQTNTVVRNVEEVNETQFYVTYEDLKKSERTTEVFDFVVVATGHFSIPYFPSYDGLDRFEGRVLHAHDFYDAAEFKDQSVVILGSSYSAEDITMQLYKYDVKKVTVVYRNKPMGFNWPDSIKEVQQLVKVDAKSCYFADGSCIQADAIIFCTGYKHHFPFMHDKLRLQATNLYYPNHLYKGVLYDTNPRVCYLGMQDQAWTFTLFDAQAWFIRDYMLGKIDIGTKETRGEDIKGWHARCLAIQSPLDAVQLQKDYVIELFKMTDYPKHDDELVAQLFRQWIEHKKENIATYRDKQFPSIINGEMAPLLKLPWLKTMDDSLDGFVNNYQ